ncbi:response regulator transcription factor [Dyadobacter sp. 676]|uniref:Response regulator transcription factor n=1 Tax=Dyadobacter sp. 676 TaxID=3088362 RepID=A0AAU8FH02_9BACT
MNHLENYSLPTRVLLVEDYAIIRLATKVLIKETFKSAIIHEAATLRDGISCLEAHEIDLVLLDIQLPDSEGVAMISKIRMVQPKVRILIFSGLNEQIYGLHYIKAGANGFLSKDATKDQMQAAISATLNDRRFLSEVMQGKILNENMYPGFVPENPLEALSIRELEVMDMLLDGLWVKEIANQLGLTESSVSTYKSKIFERLGVTTLIELYTEAEKFRQ